MNREILLRVLTVAVLAPYLFRQSQKETGYFNVGLKLLAGVLITSNVPQLMKDYETVAAQAKNLARNLTKAQETLNAQNAARTTIVADAVEAEFTDTG